VSLQEVFLPALALMLVVEGLLPLLAPVAWREAFIRMIRMKDGQIRFMGLVSILAGLLLLLFTR
jgi:uncharacterized protein YjeT (DUF2065 family)